MYDKAMDILTHAPNNILSATEYSEMRCDVKWQMLLVR